MGPCFEFRSPVRRFRCGERRPATVRFEGECGSDPCVRAGSTDLGDAREIAIGFRDRLGRETEDKTATQTTCRARIGNSWAYFSLSRLSNR